MWGFLLLGWDIDKLYAFLPSPTVYILKHDQQHIKAAYALLKSALKVNTEFLKAFFCWLKEARRSAIVPRSFKNHSAVKLLLMYKNTYIPLLALPLVYRVVREIF
jgi:hypothetical protein